MEKVLKNFEIATHKAHWKRQRLEAKKAYNETCEFIAKETEKRLADEKAVYEIACEKIRQEKKARIDAEQVKLFDRLEAIAREQDAFEDEFRNYVATIPDEIREATGKEGV